MNLDLAFLASWSFDHGVGNYSAKQACTMSAAVAATRVARGVDMNGATDVLDCVCPVVRRLVIVRNDLTPTDNDELKTWALSMIPRIVGTAGSKALVVKRAKHLARYAIRVIAAEAMDFAKLPASAAKLRSIGDGTSMIDCRDVAREARDSARRERDKRSAVADAAAAVAYAAAAYAYAAAATAADTAARIQYRLKHLDQMIADVLAITE